MSRFAAIARSHLVDIVLANQNALTKSLQSVSRRTQRPQATDFISELVTVAAKELWSSWNSIFIPLNITFEVLGAFVQQSPMLQHTAMKQKQSIEIGDLLIVHVHRQNDVIVSSIAQLFRARVTSDVVLSPGLPDDELTLYLDWPDFSFVSPKTLSGRVRSIFPKQGNRGTEYLLINPELWPPSSIPWILRTPSAFAVAHPSTEMQANLPLDYTLFQLLVAETGRPWDISASANDDWSITMNDLLQVTLNGLHARRNLGRPPAAPQSSPFFSAHTPANASTALRYFVKEEVVEFLRSGRTDQDGPPAGDDPELDPDAGWGISILYIESNAEQAKE